MSDSQSMANFYQITSCSGIVAACALNIDVQMLSLMPVLSEMQNSVGSRALFKLWIDFFLVGSTTFSRIGWMHSLVPGNV